MKTKSKKKEIKVRLTNQDFDHLNNLVKESSLSRESYLRMCINGLVPRAVPSKEFIEVIKILREIAEKMNQIAISVYTQNAMDKSFYMENYEKLQDQINEIMILIRQPINMEEVWLWAVKDDLNRVLNYIKNPDKTKEDMSDGLKEVLTYTTQGYKTNEKEFITGINCEPRTALKQMMNTKLSYNKMDGRLAFHAVQSFKPGEVTPEQCHALGVQLAKQMWGNRFEVVVSTHLDKDHLHNHFVVNSVSWVDGKKYDNKKADIDHFRELNDAICKEHGLTVITKPEGKAMNYGEWKAEKNDSIYLRKLIRYDVDSVLLYARTPEQFQSSLEEIGYVVNLNGKHWTLKHPQSKRTFRFYKLTRDNRYDEEHLMERINSNFLFPMQSSVKDVIPCKEYQGNHRKLKGIKAMYIRYCFELGILRPKGIPQKYPSPALRKDLIYMEKITDENTFVGKHNLESIEDVLAFKLNLNNQIENWMNQRRSIYNKIKRTRDPELKKQLEQDRDTLTSKIAYGKKEIRICEDIEKRVPDIEEKLKMVNALETERMQTQKEYERSLNL